jgi:hypothetical protein
MTTLTARTAPSRTTLTAALGLAATAVLTAIGTFWDATGNDGKPGSHQTREYLVTLAGDAVLLALVFGLVVRTARGRRAGVRSAALGVLAVVTLVLFWSGAPCVFAAGAIATALIERDETGAWGKAGRTGLALGVLATLVAAVFAFIG